MPFGPNAITLGYGQNPNTPTGLSAQVLQVNPAQAPANTVITGGSIDNTPIGQTTPAAGAFTTLSATTPLGVLSGGTGVGSAPANGKVLIGNGTDFTLANLTAGSGISVTNGSGIITIANTGGSGTVTSVAVSGGTTGLTISGSPVTTTGTMTIGGTLALANGGTGATTDTGARSNLGLGTIATQSAASVAITGGTITGTTVSKVTVTAPATGSTLTIADGKTFTANDTVTVGTGGLVLGNSGGLTAAASKVLTVSNSLTLAGTDGSTLNIGTGGTLGTAAYTAASAYSPVAGSASIVTTGALNSGSITSGFGAIDVGADAISGGAISGTTGTFTGAGIFGNSATGSNLLTIKGGTSGAVDGSAVYISNGASTIAAFGNKSSILGGGYDANTAIFAGAGLSISCYPDGGSTARATITSTGLNSTVIGATTPAAGSFTTLQAQSIRLTGYGSSATQGLINFEASGTTDYIYYNASTLAFRLSSSDRMNLSSTGLAVTGALSATSGVVSVATGNSGAGMFRGAASLAAQQGLDLCDSSDTSNAAFAAWRKASGTVIGSITRVTTTDAIIYNTTSDVRLKENLRDFTDSGRLIDSLRPRIFDWKSDTNGDGKNVIGFIAQEEHAADPIFAHIGAVSVGDDDPTTITRQWQRSDSALVPILVAELKDVRARLAALEAKFNSITTT